MSQFCSTVLASDLTQSVNQLEMSWSQEIIITYDHYSPKVSLCVNKWRIEKKGNWGKNLNFTYVLKFDLWSCVKSQIWYHLNQQILLLSLIYNIHTNFLSIYGNNQQYHAWPDRDRCNTFQCVRQNGTFHIDSVNTKIIVNNTLLCFLPLIFFILFRFWM